MRSCNKGYSPYLTYLFNKMWLIIGLVSAIDVFYAIKYQETLIVLEENPIGLHLIEISNGDISLFMGLKVAGTVLVLGFLQNAFHLGDSKRRIVITKITFGITLFQLWLFYYLSC